MTRRRIAVFTGNRAEYGLQYPILKAVDADPRLEYLLLAGGAHVDGSLGEPSPRSRQTGSPSTAKSTCGWSTTHSSQPHS